MMAPPVAGMESGVGRCAATGTASMTHATLQITQGSHVVLVDPTIFTGYDGLPQPVPISYGGLKQVADLYNETCIKHGKTDPPPNVSHACPGSGRD